MPSTKISRRRRTLRRETRDLIRGVAYVGAMLGSLVVYAAV